MHHYNPMLQPTQAMLDTTEAIMTAGARFNMERPIDDKYDVINYVGAWTIPAKAVVVTFGGGSISMFLGIDYYLYRKVSAEGDRWDIVRLAEYTSHQLSCIRDALEKLTFSDDTQG